MRTVFGNTVRIADDDRHPSLLYREIAHAAKVVFDEATMPVAVSLEMANSWEL